MFRSPHETVTLEVQAVGDPDQIEFRSDDVVFLTMKAQHTLAALRALHASAGEEIAVVCCQNGVANERMAAWLFRHVYGMVVILPASHLAPVAGRSRSGGSSWQSLARGTGDIEADYLNGEIVLLGRLHGVSTPANRVVQRVATRMARERAAPASLPLAELREMIASEPD